MTHHNPETLPESVQKGLLCFNQRAFYEAHEYFEIAWRQAPEDVREFYRALLHLSGGFFRLNQNRPEAARKFFAHGQKWMRSFSGEIGGISARFLNTLFERLLSALDQGMSSEDILHHHFTTITPITEVNHENSSDRI
jgi:predicted metal-dependent hydrolase